MMTAPFKQVSRDEFWEFVKAYPNKLDVDKCGISEPPLVSYNDFTAGLVWPESMIAKYNEAPYGDRIYWIKQ